ncbi:hypothetical protein GGI11_005013 [Coemansia sp. RSA 2049]|nr:hypothetical protein GGI11_005013 [Coemansia sp. RSA 2049]
MPEPRNSSHGSRSMCPDSCSESPSAAGVASSCCQHSRTSAGVSLLNSVCATCASAAAAHAPLMHSSTLAGGTSALMLLLELSPTVAAVSMPRIPLRASAVDSAVQCASRAAIACHCCTE